MAQPRQIVIVFLVSAAIIGLLTLWVAWQRGSLDTLDLFGREPEANVAAPFALPDDQDAFMNDLADNNTMETTTAILHTSRGDITLELFSGQMPVTVGNFLALASKGFYDDTKFHRVIDGFMVQGGDPDSKGADTSRYGRGGPGYTIQDEFVAGLSNVRGTIAMANSGQPNSGGSQFFINLVDNTGLDFDKPPASSRHPVFGRVVGGMDIVDAIGKIETDARDVPLEPIVIRSIEVVEE